MSRMRELLTAPTLAFASLASAPSLPLHAAAQAVLEPTPSPVRAAARLAEPGQAKCDGSLYGGSHNLQPKVN